MTKSRKSRVAKAKKSLPKSKHPVYKSFKLSKDSDKFITFRITRQTLYWLVLLGYVLLLDVWISNAQMSAFMMLM